MKLFKKVEKTEEEKAEIEAKKEKVKRVAIMVGKGILAGVAVVAGGALVLIALGSNDNTATVSEEPETAVPDIPEPSEEVVETPVE